MLDAKLLRSDLDEIADKLAIRAFQLDKVTFLHLEESRKSLQIEVENLRNERNQRSKAIGQAKAQGEDIEVVKAEVRQLGDDLAKKEKKLEDIQNKLHDFLLAIPNIPHPSVPAGKDEEDNQLVKTWGEPKNFNFPAKEHDSLGEASGLLDFATASKLSGSRFVVMKGQIARLHRALAQFMLDVHSQEHGYTEVNVPYLVDKHCLVGTGQLPKFSEDIFHIAGERALSLISTAEIPVTNMARDSIIAEDELPLKYVCHSACFRSEAGSYGKDTRGMIRQHQFEKVELVQLVKPELSYQALEELTCHAEVILEKLNLPYRRVILCGGDVGFAAAKTFDLEVWLPGQNKYREISSCSNFESFQARRMLARWRDPKTAKPELLHTINGSALAVGRTLVAVMENYQDENGNIAIPEVLQPYCAGLTRIDGS